MPRKRVEDEERRILGKKDEGYEDDEYDDDEDEYYEDDDILLQMGYAEVLRELDIDDSSEEKEKRKPRARKIEQDEDAAEDDQPESERSQISETLFLNTIYEMRDNLYAEAETIMNEAEVEAKDYVSNAEVLEGLVATIQRNIELGYIIQYFMDEEGNLSYIKKERGEMGFKLPSDKKKDK
ncbi:MAG: hypothetical protein OEX81_03930 [Candidatus Pacebacteria bacterium]|nr:hypothetical protein [Candidatus Paceibacterota bacterium]